MSILTTGAPRVRSKTPREEGGTSFESSWRTYLVIWLVTLVSIFPLYYTVVMASNTNAEMSSANSR